MKTLTLVIILFWATLSISYGQDDPALIKECYNHYKTAIRNGKGPEALHYVDAKTLNYYVKITELAQSADSLQIAELPFLEKFTTLSIRNRVSKEAILKMNGERLFVYFVESGLVGGEESVNHELGEVTVDGDLATAEFYYKGKKTPLYFQFNKEAGQWKFDLTSMFSFTTMFVKQTIETNGLSEEEFILLALKMESGENVNGNVWKPLK